MSAPWSSLYTLLHSQTWSRLKVITFYGISALEIYGKYDDLTIPKKTAYLARKLLQYVGLLFSDKIISLSTYSNYLLSKHFPTGLLPKVTIIPGFLTELKK